MKTQYYTATSLDGFIAAPNHSLDWLFQFGETATDDYPAFMAEVGAIAMGASTYEWLVEHVVGPNADSCRTMSQPCTRRCRSRQQGRTSGWSAGATLWGSSTTQVFSTKSS